jgi:hypothetical protein
LGLARDLSELHLDRWEGAMQSRRSVLYAGLAAAALLAASPAAGGFLEMSNSQGGGTVTALDDRAHSFTCVWKGRHRTYRTTDKTVYFVGNGRGSWSDLKVGASVQVKYRRSDGERVADEVRIKGG